MAQLSNSPTAAENTCRFTEHNRRLCSLNGAATPALFVAVADEESMTRAGARLHVTQPTLSRQLRDLKDELGVRLFDHGARAIRLTSAGRVFLEEARAALQRAELAVETVKAVAGGRRGKINVGYASSPSVDLLPPTLRYFHETNPEVTVQLHDFPEAKSCVACSAASSISRSRSGALFCERRTHPRRASTYSLVVALPARHPLVKATKRRQNNSQRATHHLHARRLPRLP